MLLPDTMELRICVPYNSRSTAWASFDGRGRVELKQGDHIKVTASKYPFPTVCADKQSTDWFHSISRTLKWNERERQKSFVMVEEGPAKKSPKASTPPSGLDGLDDDLNEDDEEDEEEEEKFDIDDSTTAPPSASTSAGPSLPTTPIRSRIQSKADLTLSHIEPPPPPSSDSSSATNIESSSSTQIDLHLVGARDYIHSPKSLVHGTKSRIPKDRDIESTLTPRPSDLTYRHDDRTPLASTRPLGAAPPVAPGQPLGARSRIHNRHRLGHRSSRSVDFAPSGRAFACWGQDESDSNTDSEH